MTSYISVISKNVILLIELSVSSDTDNITNVYTDCEEAARLEEEAEGFIHWRTWPGYGWSYQGVVLVACQTDLSA